MKVIIAGSRSFEGKLHQLGLADDPITRAVLIFEESTEKKVTEIVSGTARGIDRAGESWALRNNVPITRFPADWRGLGKRAGIVRNKRMAEYADALIAIWDGRSRGTKNMINEAKKQGLASLVMTITLNKKPNIEIVQKSDLF